MVRFPPPAPAAEAPTGRVRALACAALGLLLWLAAQLIAFAMAKAGDGWIGPSAFSASLLILYPVACYRLAAPRPGSIIIDLGLLMAAIALDLLLLHNVAVQEPAYFRTVHDAGTGLIAAWFGLWSAWQIVALATLLKRRLKIDRTGNGRTG